MSVQVGTVDGLINITPVIKDCFVKAIDSFSINVIKNNKLGDLSIGDAFQRYTYPVYSGQETEFKIESLKTEVTTKTGNKQSPAFVTYCKKMGLLETDGTDSFDLTIVGSALLEGQIELHEYAMLYMSKQGIFIDGQYKENLLVHIANLFKVSPSITTDELFQSIATKYGDSNFQKTRFDIILGALCAAKILSKVNNVYVLAGIAQAQILDIFALNGENIRPAVLDKDQTYADYVGTFKYGLYDFLNEKNRSSFAYLYPNLMNHLQGNYKHSSSSLPLQQIFYGAPGTGKSCGIKKIIKEHNIDEKTQVIRTTFHPDSDYSTFVGAYKPTMEELPRYNPQTGDKIGVEEKIVYSFAPQAFLEAYVAAWKNQDKPVFLVIEELNRGNCAQIFGDIFQLLDRKDNGESEYPIKADQDIRKFLAKEFTDVEGLENDIQSGKVLVLPSNLYIWATMNTSDQSLFPIDSAFKRRWDWKYVPIQDGGKKWGIQVNGLEYDWWSFLEKINDLIDSTTSSEDKKLGYFFCKPDDDKSVTADKFVNKVIFYLWNDVFKDYDMSHEAFKDENKGLAFGKFFKNDGNVNENVVMTFLDKLGVSLKGSYDSDEEEDMANLTQDEKNRNDSTMAENWKNFWQLFNESDLHKRGFNSAMGYVRGIVINDTTILIELPRNSKSPHTNTIKFVAQFNQHSLPKLELPNNEDNILWIQKTTADKDRIELHLTDVNFGNLIEQANNDLFERLSKQLDEFVKFIDEKVPKI